MEPLNVWDFEALAAERLDPGAFGFFAGGSGDEWTLRENVEGFRRWVLRPRVLVDVGEPSTTTTVFGHEVSMPLLVAPVAFQRVAHPDGEVGMARAARAVGTVMCLSTMATVTPAEVAATGVTRFFQLYVFRDEGMTRNLVEQARAADFTVLVLTVDAPVLGRRERDVRAGFTLPQDVTVTSLGRGGMTPAATTELFSPAVSWKDLDRIVSWAGLPLVVKGVLTAEDALLACEHGAQGIVVSNHGGRQLDGVPAAIDALPEVVEAVDGRIEVLVDGGVRRGTDVVRALALGARAVLAGRAPIWGLAADGEAGARRVLELLREEIRLALQLVGCRTPADVTRAHVGRRR